MRPILRTAAVLAGLATAGPARSQEPVPTSTTSSSEVDSLRSLARLTGVPIPESRTRDCFWTSPDESLAVGARLPRPIHRLFDLPRLNGDNFRVESHGQSHTAILTNAGYHITAGGPLGPTTDETGYWILSCAGNRPRPSQLHGAYVSDLFRIRGELTDSVRSLSVDFLSESAEFWLRARSGEPLRWLARMHGDLGALVVRYHQHHGAQAWYSLSRPGELEVRIGADFDPRSGRRLVQAEFAAPCAVLGLMWGSERKSIWGEAGFRVSSQTVDFSFRGRGSYDRPGGVRYEILINMELTF
jgi:hypothetical protein